MKIFRRSGLSCRDFSNSRGVGLPVCVFAIVLFFALCLATGSARAWMAPLNDGDLSSISGQSGVSLNLDGGAQVYFNILKFSDSQSTPNWIELHDVKVDNGAGGNFFFSTFLKDVPTGLVTNFQTYYTVTEPDATKQGYTWASNAYEILTDVNVQNGTIAGLEEGMKRVTPDPIFYDVATGTAATPGPGEGTTYISIRDTSGINPRWTSVGNFVFNAYNITNFAAISTAAAAGIATYGVPAGYSLSTDFNVNNPSAWTAGDWSAIQAVGTVVLSTAAANGIAAYIVTNGVEPPGLSTDFNVNNPSAWTVGDWAIIQALNTTDIINAISAYQMENTALQNQALGSIKLDALRQGPSLYRMWAPSVGQGIRFDYQTVISADALTYAYNTTATGVLKLSHMTIAGAATGTLDNPADPSTWEFGGVSNVFKIGTIGDAANAPATMDVATDSSNVTSVYMSLPMAGSIRVAEVNFGPNSDNTGLKNFGPIAIDGIQFHRLDIKLTP